MDWHVVWQILALLLVLLGIVGTVLPALPGSLIVLGGLFLGAWSDNFEYIGWFTLTVLTVLTVLTYVVDFAASALGAKRLGAHAYAIWGAAAGAIIGIFFGLPGILLGPFVGAMAIQYLHDRDLMQAGKVGIGAWLGMAVGTALKLALVFVMIGIYLLLRFIPF